MHSRKWHGFAVTIIGMALLVACGGGSQSHAPAPASTTPPATPPVAEAPAPAPMAGPAAAVAQLTGREGSGVSGTVEFARIADGVHISVRVEGLAGAGTHGFHIHEVGDCSSPDFKSAGGHFNPTDAIHGGPDDGEHHAGDLGNIEIGEDGTGTLHMNSSMLALDGPNSVIGRGIILHESQDDFASQPTGAAGARLACGVVEVAG